MILITIGGVPMEVIIKNGNPKDISIALDLLKSAAAWLRGKGIDYWQNWHDPPAAHRNWIKDGFNNGEFHFVYNRENAMIGMYRLQFEDNVFWGERDDKAGYIHSFTTNRDYKGNGLGYVILKTIESELAANGFAYLRLDCSPDIEPLCKYYENYGFEPKETVFVHGEKLRLYEKKIG